MVEGRRVRVRRHSLLARIGKPDVMADFPVDHLLKMEWALSGYIGGGVIILAPIAVACDLHIILTLFFFIMACF